MITLVINTSTQQPGVALLQDEAVLVEQSWVAAANETEKILPTLQILLKKKRHALEDIGRIIVVRGPGSFSSVRIGITIANTLSFVLKVPVSSVTSDRLLIAQAPAHAKPDVLLFAGGMSIAWSHAGRRRILDREAFFAIIKRRPKLKQMLFCHSLPPEVMKEMRHNGIAFVSQKSSLSLGMAILKLTSADLKKHPIGGAEPEYLRPPHITPART